MIELLPFRRFQSTLPHGSDDITPFRFGLGIRFQSTLPHGSDFHKLTFAAPSLTISIHAPSRERLPFIATICSFSLISIHAPSRERRLRRRQIYMRRYFNPRSLTGATACAVDKEALATISIHAPSRERRSIIPLKSTIQRFQSTLPHGSDYHEDFVLMYLGISIHAPSRERL